MKGKQSVLLGHQRELDHSPITGTAESAGDDRRAGFLYRHLNKIHLIEFRFPSIAKGLDLHGRFAHFLDLIMEGRTKDAFPIDPVLLFHPNIPIYGKNDQRNDLGHRIEKPEEPRVRIHKEKRHRDQDQRSAQSRNKKCRQFRCTGEIIITKQQAAPGKDCADTIHIDRE